MTYAKNGISSDNTLDISSGTLNINAQADAIRTDPDAVDADAGCAGNINITGGTFNLNTADDAVHSDGYIVVTGGQFNIRTGDDGGQGGGSGSGTSTSSYSINIYGGNVKVNSTGDGVRTYAVTETGNDGKVYSVVYCSTCGDELGRTVIADELVNNSTVNKTTVTAGTNVTITGSAEGGTAPYYYAYYYKRSTNTAWKTLGTEFGTNSSVAFAPTAEAYFDIKVIVKDADGNTAEKLFSVQAVAELPLTNVSVVGRTSVNLGTAIPHDRKGSRRNFSIYLFLLLQEKHKYKLEALG